MEFFNWIHVAVVSVCSLTVRFKSFDYTVLLKGLKINPFGSYQSLKLTERHILLSVLLRCLFGMGAFNDFQNDNFLNEICILRQLITLFNFSLFVFFLFIVFVILVHMN